MRAKKVDQNQPRIVQPAQCLYDCLLKIRHNQYTAGAIEKKIDETLTKYNNSK